MKRHRFPRRSKQAKTATRPDSPKRRKATNAVKQALAGVFVIVPKGEKRDAPRVIADPAMVKTMPVLTTSEQQALKFVTRQGTWKWLRRHPWLKNEFESRRIA